MAQPSPSWFTLDVSVTAQGVAQVSAQVTLPGSPSEVYALLSDYTQWPQLFAHTPRIESVTTIEDRRVLVMMHVPTRWLPFELTLHTETREFPPSKLETRLISGDFQQYAWTWEFANGHHATTHARLRLSVKPSIWLPHWLLRWVIRSELEAHFQKLRAALLSRRARAQDKLEEE